MNHQAEVTEALRVIRLIRKYPATQSPQAEKRVLSKLTVDAYIEVIAMLEKESAFRTISLSDHLKSGHT